MMIYDDLASAQKVLDNWHGSIAWIWAFTPTHHALTVRLKRKDQDKFLFIWCARVVHLTGPIGWGDSFIQVMLNPINGNIVLFDLIAGFRVEGKLIGIEESDTYRLEENLT